MQPQNDFGVEFNKTLLHILPAEIAFVSNAFMRRFTNNVSSIVIASKPFPHVLSAFERAVSSISIFFFKTFLFKNNHFITLFTLFIIISFTNQDTNLMYWSLIMFATFCLIPSGFVASIVQERVLNVKRLLKVSGVSELSYWTSNFIFDFVIFIVLILVATIIAAGAGGDNFSGDTIGALVSFKLIFYIFYNYYF